MKNNDSNIEVVKDDQLGISDLVQLQSEGFSVLRSAHVGNLSSYNLTLASAGIPVLAVDHNITGVDRNYMPEFKASQSGVERIAPDGLVVCRTTVSEAMRSPEIFLDELQVDAVRAAIPKANIFTNTEYLRANESVVGEIANIALKKQASLFNRLVGIDGTTVKSSRAPELIGRLGIMQLNDDPREPTEAVMMPNVIDIVANFVIEACKSQKEVQYHLSGPAMIKYIDGLLPDIQGLFSEIRQNASFRSEIPPKIEVRLVPTTPARFATTQQRSRQLIKLLSDFQAAQVELAEINSAKKTFFTSSDADDANKRKGFLETTRCQQTAIETQLGEQLETMPEIFIDPGESGHVTQYDVLNEDGLFVAPQNIEMSMAELAKMAQGMNLLRRKLKP